MSAAGYSFLLALSAALFAVGLFGLIARRAILFQLISVEIMLAGPALAFIAAGAQQGSAAGQGMFVLILSLAAAEAAVGLALYLRLRGAAPAGPPDSAGDSDAVSELKE